jgi:hypothetical protein
MQHIHSLHDSIWIWLRLLDFSGAQNKGEKIEYAIFLKEAFGAFAMPGRRYRQDVS